MTPDGTAKVPDEVNDVDVNVLFTVIENDLLEVFDAASTALKTKFDVVLATGFVGVPVILNLETPFSCTVADDKPAGKEPD